MLNMIQVIFMTEDGNEYLCEAQPDDSLMDVAVDNGVPGIVAQCGGGCTCCTCHCWIDPDWFDRLPEMESNEDDLIGFAWGYQDNSRLACQVKVAPELDGIRVHVPEQQA